MNDKDAYLGNKDRSEYDVFLRCSKRFIFN